LIVDGRYHGIETGQQSRGGKGIGEQKGASGLSVSGWSIWMAVHNLNRLASLG